MNHGAQVLILFTLLSPARAFSPEEIRASFEWGEYQRLIDSLEPYLITAPCTLDSSRCGQYHCYLGVAYFGKGRAGEARKQFLRALSYDPAAGPDSNYISEEIRELFAATRVDFIERQTQARAGDSLRVANRQAFDANVQAIRREEFRRSKTTGTITGLSFIILGAAFAAATGYEYHSTREPYDDFKTAAHAGDKAAFYRLRPAIQRANGIIAGCAISAGVATATGIVVTIRTISVR